jgi:hypothetical protein
MASNNKRIQVGELDFDAIKSNLKNFLKGQEEFQDYDFDGSALSILLDVLAYNTHYNGVYTNLAVNEMFLDSASKRSSVVSLAKMLGYVPRSAKSATATVNALVSNPSLVSATVTIPAMQPFTTTIDNVAYTFYNRSAKTVPIVGGTYTFNNLVLTEGTPLEYKYVVAPGTRFIIPNSNVDLDTVTVSVQENSSSLNFTNYTRAENVTEVTSQSQIYFIKEIDDGLYELNFGNGVLGKALSNGNVVTIDYMVSSLDAANSASSFTYAGSFIAGSNLSITTIEAASGGSEPESIDEIKFSAPRYYASQNRAVTPDDYAVLIKKNFPEADTIAVWGGEDNNPPIYGKTFICVKPRDAARLTNLQKDFIKTNILQSRSVVSITPEIIDPEFFNVKVTSFVYYNPLATTKTPSQIESDVKQSILKYNDDELSKFDSVLRYSKLVRIIDEADTSIISNITKVTISHPYEVSYNIATQYALNLINPISQEANSLGEPSFSTSGFYIPSSALVHYLEDDSKGNVRLFYVSETFEKVVVDARIGTIDYKNGKINVRGLTITSLENATFEWKIKPESYDVVSALNQIVQIDPTVLDIQAIADTTINGDLQAGYNYTFNSIRS